MVLATEASTSPVVLLVEDSQDERDMYTRQLVAMGYMELAVRVVLKRRAEADSPQT